HRLERDKDLPGCFPLVALKLSTTRADEFEERAFEAIHQFLPPVAFDLAFEQQRRRRLRQRARKPLFKLPQLVQGHLADLSAQEDIDVDLHLRGAQTVVKKFSYSLQTIWRVLCFVAHYLDQIGYALDRVTGRFEPSSIL